MYIHMFILYNKLYIYIYIMCNTLNVFNLNYYISCYGQ